MSNTTIIKPCEKVVQHMQDCEYYYDSALNRDLKLNSTQKTIAYNSFGTPCAHYLGLYLNHCLHNGNKLDEIAVEKQRAGKR